MTAKPTLNQFCKDERKRIQQRFEFASSARETLAALCRLADKSIEQIFLETFGHGTQTQGFSLLALGGYGRQHLFPYSDLDILFLFNNKQTEHTFQPSIADFCRALWDLGFRVSSAGRTLEECKRIEEDNAEFHLALLDRRFLAGDQNLFGQLDQKVLPISESRARRFLLTELHRLTQERLAHFGNTIFHLEPNVKEAPGGLRDYQAATWLRQLAREKKELSAPGAGIAEEALAASAVEFLSAVRCFLHYSNGRNDNTLTYEFQAVAAQRSLADGDAVPRNAAQWMRIYFRHARTLNRQLLRFLEQKPRHASRTSGKKTDAPSPALLKRLLGAARGLKTEAEHRKPFVVRNGLLEVLDISVLFDRSVALSLFAEAARSGMPLSHTTERNIAYILSHPELWARNREVTWAEFREILAGDFPCLALRPMYHLGLLSHILPEFRLVDSLVVRDFYHRYTVDEHSLRAIEGLQELADASDERDKYFINLWKSLEHRDLLVLALLLHDVGKGMPIENHVTGSLQALDSAALHLQLDPQEKDEVRFLIEHHLDMSATLLRRDIFDPETIATFSQTVSTVERLSRLCLLTYADIHAVNPEALTPWKAEMLWQLFAATYNQLNRSLDRDRLHAIHEIALLDEVLLKAEGARRDDIERFLEGFPRRYLAVHPPAEIASHFLMSSNLDGAPVQIDLRSTPQSYSLTLLARDRPALFATIAGVLAGWSMNIIKAEAFANDAGIVMDTFQFTDLHRTLELNPGEDQRLRRSLVEIVSGQAPLAPLLKAGLHSMQGHRSKVAVVTQIRFDQESSSRSTLLEILTQDRPGLLQVIGSVLAQLQCNIEVALIDTEGHKAIDVFYLTRNGAKLSPELQERIATELRIRL